MNEQLCQIWRRCAPPFFCYLRKTDGGGGHICAPPAVRGLKLPPDLVVGDSRAGVGRGDLPKFNIIQKSTPYQETVIRLLSTCDPADAAVNQISAVSLAHLRFLQEEYMQLLVSSQFVVGTAKMFWTLQQNPAAFTPNSLENLQRAVSIAGARQYHQVSSPRGRRFSQPGEAAAGLAASSSTARGGAVAKEFSQLTGASSYLQSQVI